MANDSAKKLVKRNRTVLRNALISAVVFFLLHILGLFAFQSASGGLYSIVIFFVINVVALGFFFKSATAKYDAEGSLVDPGQDLSLKGLMDFVWDFIYVTWFCQIATLFSAWLWLLMLVIPIYGAIKLIGFARSMGGMGQPPQAEPEAPTKRSRATKEPTKMKFVKGSR